MAPPRTSAQFWSKRPRGFPPQGLSSPLRFGRRKVCHRTLCDGWKKTKTSGTLSLTSCRPCSVFCIPPHICAAGEGSGDARSAPTGAERRKRPLRGAGQSPAVLHKLKKQRRQFYGISGEIQSVAGRPFH